MTEKPSYYFEIIDGEKFFTVLNPTPGFVQKLTEKFGAKAAAEMQRGKLS